MIRKLIIILISMLILGGCASETRDDVVVFDSGDGNYQIMVKDEFTKDDAEFIVEGDKVTFPDKDISANLDEVYTYSDIDPLEFLKYLKSKGHIESELEPSFIATSSFSYQESLTMTPGFSVMYVYDDGDNWKIYSYIGILQNGNDYYSFNLLNSSNQRYDFAIDQKFDNPHPTLAEISYSKEDWPYEKFTEWCSYNYFAPFEI